MGHVCRIHEGDQHCVVVVPYPYNGSIVDGLTIIWGIQSAGGTANVWRVQNEVHEEHHMNSRRIAQCQPALSAKWPSTSKV